MRRWLPPILWTAVVLGASIDLFSAAHTGSILEAVVRFLLGHPLPRPRFDTIHFLIRKGAHLTEYGILGFLWFRALRDGRAGVPARHRRASSPGGIRRGATPPRGGQGCPPDRWSWRWALTAIAIAGVVASADEFHQSFVPSRGPSPYDVMLDIAGATLVMIGIRVRMLLSPSP